MSSEGWLTRLIREMTVFAWPSQAKQYPSHGAPGIGYMRADVSDSFGPGAYIDCLLCRDVDGSLVGILNHYPQDFPPHEKAGAINVFVRPDRMRRGIGTKLVAEAMSRWAIDLQRQQYTRAGAEFAESLIRSQGGDDG